MTATAEIVTANGQTCCSSRRGAALHPTKPAEAQANGGGGLVASLLPVSPGLGPGADPERPGAMARCGRSGCCGDGQPVAVPVTVGSSDGRMTEVTGEGLERACRSLRQFGATP